MHLKKIIKKIIPLSLRQSLRIIQSEFQFIIQQTFSIIFERNKLRKITDTHLLLNIGCGKTPKAGWINIDINPYNGVYYCDVTQDIPLRNESVRHIHCENLLEHLDYEYAGKFLTECLRVLEKSGSLRLILPDAEKYLRAYCQNDNAFFEALKDLGSPAQPLRTRIEIINQMFRMGGAHKFAWDLETLLMVLKEVGFTRVEKSRLGDIDHDLNIDLTDYFRPLECLYVDAYK